MHVEFLSHWSSHLNCEMYVNRYGHAGMPVVVFASSGGSHNEYADFGMIEACSWFIETGKIQFFTLSSVDSESWLADWKAPHDRAEMLRAYEHYVIEEAIPFIITGSAIQLFQIIDQMTFINTMKWFTNYSNSQLVVMFSYFSANPNKITMILIAVATSIGGVGIPLLTENYVKGDLKAAARLVQDNLSMLLLFLLPATIGSVLVARPLYTIFYGRPDSLALGLFIFAMLQTIILGVYTVLSPMIQALFQNRKAIIYFGYGVLVKLILQIPFIYLFRAYGPLLATTIGLIVPIILMYQHIRQVTGLNQTILFKRSLLIGILTAVMALLIAIVEVVLGFVFHPSGRISSMLYLVIIGGLGIAIYGAMALRVRLLDRFIGEKAQTLRQKFHIH